MTFETWMEDVDEAVGNIAFGISVYDLPDMAFRDMYDSGETSQEAAVDALENGGFPFHDMEGYL